MFKASLPKYKHKILGNSIIRDVKDVYIFTNLNADWESLDEWRWCYVQDEIISNVITFEHKHTHTKYDEHSTYYSMILSLQHIHKVSMLRDRLFIL